MRQNMKKTKEEMVDGDLFCFLVEAESSVVCRLQGYGGLGTSGPRLGRSIYGSYWDCSLFFCA